MRKIILTMLLSVVSSSAMADMNWIIDEFSKTGWVRDLTSKESFAAADEHQILGDWLVADRKANESSPIANDGSCSDQHKYTEEKLQDNVKIKELLHATIAVHCDKDKKMIGQHYQRALQNGSYAALSWLHKLLEETTPSRFILHKPYPPMIGMSKSEVNGCHWGSPSDKVKRTTQGGTTEMWVYAGIAYVYFSTEGLVESITEP